MTYRILRQRVRVSQHPERIGRLVLVIVDAAGQTVGSATTEAEALRVMQQLRGRAKRKANAAVAA